MKKLLYLLPSLLLFFNSVLSAQTEVDLYLQGNGQYEAGEYEVAIKSYMDIVEMGLESPELWYNLGNSYYKLGRSGYSILAYERAKKLSPGDESILYNLKAANLSLKDKVTAPRENMIIRSLRSVRDMVSSDELIKFLILLYLASIFIYALTLFMINGKIRRALNYSLIAFGTLFFFTSVFGGLKIEHELNSTRAVVMVEEMSVSSAPEEIGEELFLLHEGTSVELIGGSDSWVQIRLIDGKSGWAPAEMLEVI